MMNKTTETRTNLTALLGGCNMLVVIVLFGLIPGCTIVPDALLDAQPDMKAIVAVVTEAYGQLERAASVFLGTDSVEDTTMARVRSSLSDDLASTFRPASDRIFGDPGASIALGRFNELDDGRLSVVASFVEGDGTGRGCLQYTLDRDGDDWLVVGSTDVLPDCPISVQGETTFRDALSRTQSEDCLAFGISVGICEPWLYVTELSGFHGTTAYFDPNTGLLVAKRLFDDTGLDDFVFGEDLGCDPTVAETIPCDEILSSSEIVMCGAPTPPDALCPTDYLPVCGEDRCTYTNICNACRSVILYSVGECLTDLDCDRDHVTDSCDVDSDCPSGVCPDGASFVRFHCSDRACSELVYVRDPCEPISTSWTECSSDALYGSCDFSLTPVCGDDNRTYRNASEACCSISRYQDGACVAGVQSRADECREGGGFWDCGGLSQCWFCNQRATDAGESCTDSNECDGWCIAEGLGWAGQDCSDVEFGTCSSTSTVFGCFCVLSAGRGSGICID